jgi:hypothetical protein
MNGSNEPTSCGQKSLTQTHPVTEVSTLGPMAFEAEATQT